MAIGSPLKVVIFVICMLHISTSFANDIIDRESSLQKQINTLKLDMIVLGRDIKMLEEVLLYPSKSRVSVFLTMDVAELFSLEKIKLLLDNEIVAEQVYSVREVTGFGKGAAQRLFIGNLEPGNYKFTAIFFGRGPRGRLYKRGVTRKFHKANKQKIFEIDVDDNMKKQQPIFYIRDES